MVKVAVALPVPNQKIIGGYKVVYEYTNYLAENGLDVSIIYNSHDGENAKGLPKFIVMLIRWVTGTFGPSWFKLSHNIHKIVQKYDGEFELSMEKNTAAAHAVLHKNL